jgi:hypothetical protein
LSRLQVDSDLDPTHFLNTPIFDPEISEISESSGALPPQRVNVFSNLANGNRFAFPCCERLGEMTLRIQRSVESDLVVFKLTGRIQAAEVPDLLSLLRPDSSLGGVVIDLEQVKLVDRDAVLFLALSEATGAKLRNCSAYIREWITQETSAMNRNKTEDPTGFGG